MGELAIQILIICTIKQLIPVGRRFFYKINFDKIWSKIKHFGRNKIIKKYKPSELNSALGEVIRENFELQDCPEVFSEYKDYVVQAGFLTMFGVSLPIAPVLYLFVNLFKLRMDAGTYVRNYKRPISFNCNSIGGWNRILGLLARISILINAVLIAFTFDYLPSNLYKYDISPNNSFVVLCRLYDGKSYLHRSQRYQELQILELHHPCPARRQTILV